VPPNPSPSESVIAESVRESAGHREREAKYRRLFDSLGEAVLIYTVVRDGRGELVDWVVFDANEEALRGLGLPLERLVGRRATDVFGGEGIEAFIARSREVMATGRRQTFDARLGWSGRECHVSMFPLDHWHLVTASIDITERVRAEAALRENDRRKTEFLAMLSHELRNPLAPIRSALYVLEHAPEGGEQAERAREVIARQTEHLAHLVDDLLDLTRISSGKIQLRRERVELGELVRRAAEDHRATLEGARVALAVEGSGDPLEVDADPTRLAQIVGNLLANAEKFTEPGGHVAVEIRREGAAAVVRVKDDGAGIEPEVLRGLFQPFVQAEEGLERARGGLGLGLYLVRSLTELHGGTVAARSAGPGRGAEFEISLPLASAEAPARAARGDGLFAAEKRRVLVIEDNADAAEMLRDVLELAHHDVEVACDGRAGLARARSLRPDLVLCDIGLPGMDGYAVAREIRRDPDLAATLLVAVSGYALPEDVRRAAEAGFDRHLAKPVSMDELGEVLGAARPA
jgi:signal transduction histidine kinase/CheY-like chemotaxis protein